MCINALLSGFAMAHSYDQRVSSDAACDMMKATCIREGEEVFNLLRNLR